MQFKKSHTAWAVSILMTLGSSGAQAANECGAAVANTATCNGDGTPASDTNPYASGISYTGAAGNHFLLNLDGTGTPLTINGNATNLTAVFASAPAGFVATYNLTGPVTVDRTVNAGGPGHVALGSPTGTASRGIAMNLGTQSAVKLTRIGASSAILPLYAVAAYNQNNPITIDSQAAITVNASDATAGNRPFAVAIVARDEAGGGNSVVSVRSRGPIVANTVSNSSVDNGSVQGIYASSDVAGSTSSVSITNESTVSVTNTGSGTSCYGLTSVNNGSGGTLVTNNGSISVSGDCRNLTGTLAISPTAPATVLVNAPITITANNTTHTFALGARASTAGFGTIDVAANITVTTNAAAPNPADFASISTLGTGTYAITVNSGRTVSMSAAGATAIGAYAAGGGTTNLAAASVVTNLSGATGNAVTAGAGPDVLNAAGTITGVVAMGLGNDSINLLGGTLSGDIYGDAKAAASATDGNDDFVWSAGTWAGNFYGQNGSDTVTIAATAPYDGSNVLDGGDDVSAADGWIDTLTLRGQTVSTAGASLLNWERVVLADASAVTLTDASITVGATAGLGLDINSGSRLRTAGAFSVAGNILNQGTVAQQNGSAVDKLSVNGTYTGGGSLELDVVFNAGDAATQADQLRVIGDVAAGSPTTLNLINLGGLGAATTGNGILLVEVTGTSPADAFVLAGPGYVDVGAFRYSLLQVGNNWYLQSAKAPPVIPTGTTPIPVDAPWMLALLTLLIGLGAGWRRKRSS